MRILVFLFLGLLAPPSSVGAFNSGEPNLTQPKSPINNNCQLPSPTDLHILQRGPTYVKLGWTPIIDAAAHRVRVYRADNGLLLSNIVTAPGVSEVEIFNLPQSITLKATVTTLCEDETDGDESDYCTILAFITDLIVAGYSPATVRDCSISAINQQCGFAGNGTVRTFEVVYNNERRKFGVTRNLSNLHWQVNLGVYNTNQKFKIYCEGAVSPNCFNTPTYLVTYESILGNPAVSVGTFELNMEGSNEGIFKANWLADGAVFNRLLPASQRPGETPTFIQERDASNSENFEFAFASPNPFANVLDVFPGRPEAQNIQLQLFNLSGQKVLDQQFGGGQEQYTLSTEGLASGFYLLRIEADGEVQTLKVIKSE